MKGLIPSPVVPLTVTHANPFDIVEMDYGGTVTMERVDLTGYVVGEQTAWKPDRLADAVMEYVQMGTDNCSLNAIYATRISVDGRPVDVECRYRWSGTAWRKV